MPLALSAARHICLLAHLQNDEHRQCKRHPAGMRSLPHPLRSHLTLCCAVLCCAVLAQRCAGLGGVVRCSAARLGSARCLPHH